MKPARRLPPQIFLHLEGPLVWAGPRPEGPMVAAMAADLRRLNALGSEGDAIRALAAGPYRLGDVAALAGDALFEARQAIAAETMAGST